MDQDKSLADTIEKTLRYIDQHLDSNLNLSTLAEQSAYSPYHFHRVFHRIVGKTAANYIRERRLSKAAEELVSSDKRILEIAVAFGFFCQESFTRILPPEPIMHHVKNVHTPCVKIT
ncbi:AraC-like DNA-binding protein [Laceyella sacchari]|uniref:helix-turn-helix domain-containing protein n=1 Tax=Laceyella sacchari TaxID=37482 RepID=UPI0010DB7F2F|nr:helix-turn-helix domain-containing protein [Laceyella sacchari]TCW41580.1 AraC-like DNA-binding protein [Laceyella sacchari]